jgi:integrase
VSVQPKRTSHSQESALDGRAAWGGELIRQRDHVALLVGWNAALRRSELVALEIADADFDSDDVVLIQIRRSKTDQFGEGAEVPIRNPNSDLPEAAVVTLLKSWIGTLRSLGADDSYPLFPSFDRHGGLKRKADSTVPNAITGGQWSERLADLAMVCEVFGPGKERKYDLVSGHSLRRGFVTQAIMRGVDVVQISKVTRHANVQMIALYADKILAREADWTSYLFGDDQLGS